MKEDPSRLLVVAFETHAEGYFRTSAVVEQSLVMAPSDIPLEKFPLHALMHVPRVILLVEKEKLVYKEWLRQLITLRDNPFPESTVTIKARDNNVAEARYLFTSRLVFSWLLPYLRGNASVPSDLMMSASKKMRTDIIYDHGVWWRSGMWNAIRVTTQLFLQRRLGLKDGLKTYKSLMLGYLTFVLNK